MSKIKQKYWDELASEGEHDGEEPKTTNPD